MTTTAPPRLRATVNCDMGEAFGIYTLGDDASLIQSVHLANIACGFHASDFTVMNATVLLAAERNGVSIGAHPSLPDLQGFGRREIAITPDELKACLTYQVGALCGFLLKHQRPLNHIKLHGSLYGQTARDPALADAAVSLIPSFYPIAEFFKASAQVAFLGLAGTEHQRAAHDANVRFLAEWFADLDYDANGALIITQRHDPVSLDEVTRRVVNLLKNRLVTSPPDVALPNTVADVSICVHSDTPGAVDIAQRVKMLVDAWNAGSSLNQEDVDAIIASTPAKTSNGSSNEALNETFKVKC